MNLETVATIDTNDLLDNMSSSVQSKLFAELCECLDVKNPLADDYNLVIFESDNLLVRSALERLEANIDNIDLNKLEALTENLI